MTQQQAATTDQTTVGEEARKQEHGHPAEHHTHDHYHVTHVHSGGMLDESGLRNLSEGLPKSIGEIENQMRRRAQ